MWGIVNMATKSTAKAKTTAAKSKSTSKSSAKPVKATNKAPASAKKAVTKATAKKASVKAAVKSSVKVAPKKVAAKAVPAQKAPVKAAAPLVQKIAAKPVDTRKTLDRAPAPQDKAPLSAVAARPQNKALANFAPQPGSKKNFAVGEYVVYPTHGVGKIMGHEVEKIGDHELKVFVIAFEKDKMTLRVPVGRAEAAGLRSISTNDQISKALATLKSRAKIARGMWSRRAQEYEAKINSGNLVAIAEVVRDLHKNVDQSERSYSERMIYETALHRLSGEVAASERVDVKDAQDKLLVVLRKQAALAA